MAASNQQDLRPHLPRRWVQLAAAAVAVAVVRRFLLASQRVAQVQVLVLVRVLELLQDLWAAAATCQAEQWLQQVSVVALV
jgi:hypothetical protein